jgi:hypothetical protein
MMTTAASRDALTVCATVGILIRGAGRIAGAVIVSGIGAASPVLAQEHVTFRSDLLFYGDNTEFRNPFREGETIFGTAARAAAVFGVGETVTVALGVFGNVRYGSDDAFELVRPVLSLTITGKRSAFVFGTLQSPRVGEPPGPDRTGPHGLLPPLQRETLAFDRPYEAGMQWRFTGSRLRHDLWINWQRLNTAAHRERFDGGAAVDIGVSPVVAIPVQFHVVHEGGQLFASGPVADSAALATGVTLRAPIARLDAAALELFALVSRYVPDRSQPVRRRDGAGFFGRASAERSGWRGHLTFWRGDDFIKDEGDPNYLSLRRNGTRYRGVRDYAEAGLTRTFKPAAGILLEASGRLHRVERHYEYSFRIVGVARIELRLH